MEFFTRLNRKSIGDRQVDTLIVLSKGVIVDGKVDQKEAEFLMTWLVQSRHACDNPIVIYLLERVSAMLEDGLLDAQESAELLNIPRRIAGEPFGSR